MIIVRNSFFTAPSLPADCVALALPASDILPRLDRL
jgi:hypothetical protein